MNANKRRDTDLMMNLANRKTYMETIVRITNEKDNQIKLALANIRAAMTKAKDEAVLNELRSAEHHLTREV